MKWLKVSLLFIWLCLLGLGIYWAWVDFNNATTIAGGGYLYGDDGKVIGMWDRWDKANYPSWMFPIWGTVCLLIGMPLWWMVAYWGIGVLLVIPYLMTNRSGEEVKWQI